MYNLLIRPLEIEDAQISWRWRNDPEVWKFTGSKPNIEISPEIELQWLQKVINEESSKRFAIVVNEKYIGNIQLTNITKNSAVFHIFIGDKNYWGKGISSLATYQLLYFAKTVLKLKTVELEVNISHIAAIKSYESTGFKRVSQNEQIICMSHDLSELQTPTLSVFVMVYNHEKFLKQCLDGILMQKCNFNFDIVVGEDCSSDNSREILINYQKNHPGKFKLLLHKTNIGANKNQEQVLDNCTGRYIAICEGDDYWTDPLKLQKQVDFLENNPDYSICFHNVDEVDENGKILDNRLVVSDALEKTYSIEDLAEGNFIHTASVLFRRNFNELPSWFFTSPVGDYPLHMMNASYGLIKYFPEKMAAYRIGQGVWSSQTRQVQFVNTIFVIKLMMANLNLSNQAIKNFDNQISRLLLHIKDIVSPLDILSKSPENAAYNLSFKKLIIILIKKIRYSF